MTPELKKLLFAKLLYGEENADKRINGIDRRKIYSFLIEDRRIGSVDRRKNVSELLNHIQNKYRKAFE